MTNKTFSVNENNDIFLDSFGNLSISNATQAVLQQCAQAAKTLLGEMVYNVSDGVPYFQTLWIGVPNISQYLGALRRAFLSVTDVVEVVSLIADVSNNTLTYTAIIRTIYGGGGFTDSVTQTA